MRRNEIDVGKMGGREINDVGGCNRCVKNNVDHTKMSNRLLSIFN